MRKPAAINIFLTILMLSAAPTAFAQNKMHFVKSFDDFISHTKSHIAEAQALAKFAHIRWTVDFADVPSALLTEFMTIHDLAKTADLETLRRFGYKGKITLGERLYEFYGKDISALSDDEKIRFRAVVNEVNEVDNLIRLEFLKSRGLINDNGYESPVVKKLYKLEALGDLTSRASNRVSPEEFAREMKPASDFFKTPSDKVKAIWMQALFPLIVDGKFVRAAGPACKRIHLK